MYMAPHITLKGRNLDPEGNPNDNNDISYDSEDIDNNAMMVMIATRTNRVSARV